MSLVYFDLDGVLADFDEAYDRLIRIRKYNNDVHWDLVQKIPDFFENMKRMPRALELWNMVPVHRRRILSSIPKSVEVSGDQKRAWVYALPNPPMPEHIHLVRGKKLKQAFAQPGHILIDDWEQNVLDWREAGGVGLHYRNADQAIRDLAVLLAGMES